MSEREREMTNESISIIIKVGKKSNMKFSHSKAYRALIPEDLDILHRSHPDCHLVIIENIKEDEEDAVRKFIQSFESESDENKVLFYIPDEDDLETLGLADELNFDIYMTLEDIYFAMKGLGYSLDVAATLDSRREYFKEMSKAEDLEGVTDKFGGIGEIQDSIDKENINTDESIDKENESIEEENWQEDFDVSDTPSEDSYTSEKKTSKVSLAKDTSEKDEADLFEGMGSFEDELETVEENNDSTQEIESVQETESIHETENTHETESAQEIESNASDLSEADNDEIDRLRTELRDARYDYGMAVKDVQEANKRIEDLENVIKALKDEKKDIVDRFNAIKDNGDVFDDADYSDLERKLQQSTSSIDELTAELNKEKSEVENLTTDLNDKVEQLNELNSKIESGEIHAEIVADYEKKLSELSDKYNDALKKFENEQGKVNEISDNSNKELELMSSDLTNVKNERDKFKGDIDRLNKQLKSSEEKVENITKERDDLKKKVESLEKEKKDLTKERDNLKAECDGLKSERDTLKINVGDLETDKETLTERVETLEKEKSELEQKKSSIEGKQARLLSEKEKLTNEKSELANAMVKLTNEKIALEDERRELKDRQKSIEAEKKDLENEKNSLAEKVSQLESLEDTSEKNEESLNEKIESLAKEKSHLEDKLEALENEKEQLSKKVEAAEKKADAAEKKADAAEFAKFEIEETATVLKKSTEALDRKLNDKQSEIDQLKETITNLNLQLDECKADLSLATDANSKMLEQQGDINSQHKDEIDKLKQQISGLETKLKLTNEQLEQKEQQYSVLVAQQADKSAGASALASTNQTLEIVNKTLSEQLSVANKDITALKNSRAKLTSEVKNYKDKCNQLDSALKNTVKALGSGAGNTEKKEQTSNSNSGIGYQYLAVKPINYTGSAKIIPVFGCGGTGITTAAVSLASKICLTSNVLYIDMDITQASADAWFGQTPLCGGLSGLGLMDIECTGLGIFYEKGFNIFNNNLDKIIKNVEHTKGGGTDYLSGLIHRVDDERIANADYTSLFNRLGEKYTYIVVDLGRVGNSRINDSLIKAIFDISATNMAVVPQNYFSIRNFLLKVNEAKVDMRKLKLVINMCTATALDRRTKQALTSKSISKYVMLLSDQNMVCIKDTFIHNKLNRDKFAAFVNSDLF